MESRELGTSHLELSVLGLGTMTFGAESDERSSHRILDHYYEAGGRFIDTADVYSRGVSEQIVGRWLDANRPIDVVVATKARFAMGDGPDDSGAGTLHLNRAVDASLQRLGVEVIDLYQMHAWDPEVPIEETLGALDEMVTNGKVRHIGVSNYTGWQLERAVQVASRNGWAPVVSMQPQYNLLAREIELDLMPACLDNEIGMLPWSPLGGGWLTGKYRAEERPSGETRLGEDPGRGVEAYDLRNTTRTWDVIAEVEAIARRRHVAMSQVAINWLRNRPGVISVLLGCRTVEQLTENLGSTSWNLDESEMRKLTESSAPGIPTYPYGFLEHNAGVDTWERLGTRVEPAL
jgi:aryl-alcohol dehydrogenase-like predicted oxidoreductase